MFEVAVPQHKEALSVSAVSRGIDRIEVTFDEPNLVANAGLLLVATLVVRLGLERLINEHGRPVGPGRRGPARAQGADAGARHGGGRDPHRPRRHAAAREPPSRCSVTG